MGYFVAKASMKGQITIPAEVRKRLGLPPGGRVMFTVADDGSVSLKAKKQGIDHLYGMFRHKKLGMSDDEAIMKTLSEKHRIKRRSAR